MDFVPTVQFHFYLKITLTMIHVMTEDYCFQTQLRHIYVHTHRHTRHARVYAHTKQIITIKAIYAVWWIAGSHCLLSQLGGAANIRVSWIPVNSLFNVPDVNTRQFYFLWNEKSHVLCYYSHLSLIFFIWTLPQMTITQSKTKPKQFPWYFSYAIPLVVHNLLHNRAMYKHIIMYFRKLNIATIFPRIWNCRFFFHFSVSLLPIRTCPANLCSRSVTVCFTCARNIVFRHKINFCADVEHMVCFPRLWVCFICVSFKITHINIWFVCV